MTEKMEEKHGEESIIIGHCCPTKDRKNPQCRCHKYEKLRVDPIKNDDRKNDRFFFTVLGRCIHCGAILSWCNYVDTAELRENIDEETGLRILTVLDVRYRLEDGLISETPSTKSLMTFASVPLNCITTDIAESGST